MIQIANLKIDPKAPEYLPESLARESCVLPLGLDGNALRVVFDRRPDYRECVDKLQFVLDRPVVWAVADRARLERAIDEVYTYLATEVENCPLDFQVQCPKRWLELRPIGRADVRFCESCNREVHLCPDENAAIEHAQAGRCVALFRAVENDCVDVGLIGVSLPIEQEQLPAFRAALQAVDDSLVVAAALGGEIFLLETAVCDARFLERFESVHASPRSRPHGRSETRERREAIGPYLGETVLHGILSHAGRTVSALVEKASGRVIYVKSNRLFR